MLGCVEKEIEGRGFFFPQRVRRVMQSLRQCNAMHVSCYMLTRELANVCVCMQCAGANMHSSQHSPRTRTCTHAREHIRAHLWIHTCTHILHTAAITAKNAAKSLNSIAKALAHFIPWRCTCFTQKAARTRKKGQPYTVAYSDHSSHQFPYFANPPCPREHSPRFSLQTARRKWSREWEPGKGTKSCPFSSDGRTSASMTTPSSAIDIIPLRRIGRWPWARRSVDIFTSAILSVTWSLNQTSTLGVSYRGEWR